MSGGIKYIAVLLCVILAFPAGIGQAAIREKDTIYVSPNGIYSDFTSIKEAVSVAAPGVTIVLRDGTYTETGITFSRSGSPGAPITLKSENKHGALLLGNIIIAAEYIKLDGLKMDGRSTVTNHAVHLQQPNATVVNMDIRNYRNYAVYSDVTRGNTVGGRNAYIAYNYTANMLAGFNITFDTILEYNEMEGVTTFGTTGENGDFCRVFGNNIVVRGNFYHGTRAENLKRPGLDDVHADFIQSWDDIAVEVKNILVEDNIVFGKYHQGIMLENDRYVPEGRVYISDWTIRNNIFAGFTAWAICAGKVNGGIPNLNIVNNTFVGDTHNGTKTWHGVGLTGIEGSAVIKNNIFVGTYSSSYFAADGAVIEADNNLIFNAPPPQTPGPNDIIGSDPMFVKYDPELYENGLLENDYRLTDVSPAIDKGADTNVKVDMDKNRRPTGAAHDIGAFEFQGEPGNVAPILSVSGVRNGDVVKENEEINIEVEATDSDGIAKVEFYYKGQMIKEQTQPPYQCSVTAERGAQTIYAIAYDNTGLFTQSGIISVFVSDEPYIDSEGTWRNTKLTEAYKGTFSATFTLLPLMGETNSVIGLSEGDATGFPSMAAGVRISPTGVLDVRNGGAYAVDADVPYEPGKMYKIRMDINIVDQTYDVYCTTEDGRTRKLATGYEFRSKPRTLDTWFTFAESGSAKIFSFTTGKNLVDIGGGDGSGQQGEQSSTVYVFKIDYPDVVVNGMNIEIDLGIEDEVVTEAVTEIGIETGTDVETNGETDDGIEYVIEYETGEQTDDEAEDVIEYVIDYEIGTVTGVGVESEVEAELKTKPKTAPLLIDGTAMIPVAAFVKVIGGVLEWDAEQQNIYIETKTDIVEMWVGEKSGYVNGKLTQVDITPIVIDQYVYIPLRFVGEMLGFTVEWNRNTQEITVRG